MTQVKICGLRVAEHALAAVAAGADMLGFVFAPSRRQVTPAEAAALVQAVRAAQPTQQVMCVGLFVNEQPARIIEIIERCGLDAAQLSGDEPYSILAALPADLPLLKAVRLGGTPEEHAWLAADAPRVTLLVDAHVPGSYGGTGVAADWAQAATLARQRPILLAGGLTPDNIGAAMRQVQPWGVDVSGGVETRGAKDSAKIHAFVAAARAADADTPVPHQRGRV